MVDSKTGTRGFGGIGGSDSFVGRSDAAVGMEKEGGERKKRKKSTQIRESYDMKHQPSPLSPISISQLT